MWSLTTCKRLQKTSKVLICANPAKSNIDLLLEDGPVLWLNLSSRGDLTWWSRGKKLAHNKHWSLALALIMANDFWNYLHLYQCMCKSNSKLSVQDFPLFFGCVDNPLRLILYQKFKENSVSHQKPRISNNIWGGLLSNKIKLNWLKLEVDKIRGIRLNFHAWFSSKYNMLGGIPQAVWKVEGISPKL